MILFGLTLFLSSFLLFVVQPLLGKYLLPWFGGSPAVWTTCMLFFQALLLAGYTYAHILASRARLRSQAVVHLALLTAAIAALPIIPSVTWKPAGTSYPFWRILGLLAVSAGAPYLSLSAVSPLLQSWYSRVRRGASPYRLYSLSNLGSLLAIVSYPTLIEPHISLNRQVRLWSWLYAAFVALCGLCALAVVRSGSNVGEDKLSPADVDPANGSSVHSAGRRLFWLLLPACGSIMLLATTNQLCQDVAVIPLLWLLPLGLYLLSFILCFHSARWYSRLWFGAALAVALAQACYVLFGSVFVDLRLQIASYSFTLFVCCMVCHGELVRLKPEPRELTSFYWMIAAGGALGGLVVSFGAPLLFTGFWEFHLGLVTTALLFLIAMFSDPASPLQDGRPFWAWTIFYAAFVCLLISLGFHIRESLDDRLEATRNFFGVLRVLELEKNKPREHRYTLMHGRIEHGFQFQDENKRYWPTSYFGPGSGIGIALRYHPKRLALEPARESLRIGVVGLGTGTIATYCRPGDSIRFYEINADVVRLARKYFTYLPNCLGKAELALGDARISMEREMERGERQQFDVLGIDAFSSDAIPVHLLTRECFRLYQYHLKPDGILAFHISNRYFDLAPVIRSLAELEPQSGRQVVLVAGKGDESQGTDSTDWVLITANRQFLDSNAVQRAIQPWAAEDRPPLLWTDDYSNLLRLLK
jgi:hypothetical protein